MIRPSTRTLVMLLTVVIAGAYVAAAMASRAAAQAPGGKLFDGKEKTFVFVGYSTSYRWPNILELMMNRRFDDQIVYHLMNAAEGGAPVGTWIAEPGTRDWERSYERMLKDWFLPVASRPEMKGRRRFSNIPAPTVALLQQSLQLTSPIIQGPDDAENIRKGADAMQALVERLHGDGVQLVFLTTHIYKYTHEPQVEHEKYALAELLSRKLPYVWPGPDVWTATKKRWPEVFTQPDQVHLNHIGDGLDATLWYDHLLRYDRGELEQTLESAWGPNWRPSVTLAERKSMLGVTRATTSCGHRARPAQRRDRVRRRGGLAVPRAPSKARMAASPCFRVSATTVSPVVAIAASVSPIMIGCVGS